MSARSNSARSSCGVTKRGTNRTSGRARPAAASDARVHHRAADDPELGAGDAAPGLEQRLDPLVRADQAEAEHDRRRRRRRSSAGSGVRPQRADRRPGVPQRAVMDHVDRARVEAVLRDDLLAGVLGVDDDRVDAAKASAGSGRRPSARAGRGSSARSGVAAAAAGPGAEPSATRSATTSASRAASRR